MNKLFENPGQKVKTLALVIFWLILIASVVGFIILLTFENATLSGIAFGVLIGGAVGAWVGAVVLYAFGQLVEDTAALRAKVNPATALPKQAPFLAFDSSTYQEEALETKQKQETGKVFDGFSIRKFIIILLLALIVLIILVIGGFLLLT